MDKPFKRSLNTALPVHPPCEEKPSGPPDEDIIRIKNRNDAAHDAVAPTPDITDILRHVQPLKLNKDRVLAGLWR